MSWVDLGTDVDWARRTVEQMEKVFFCSTFFGFFFLILILRTVEQMEKGIFLLNFFWPFSTGELS